MRTAFWFTTFSLFVTIHRVPWMNEWLTFSSLSLLLSRWDTACLWACLPLLLYIHVYLWINEKCTLLHYCEWTETNTCASSRWWCFSLIQSVFFSLPSLHVWPSSLLSWAWNGPKQSEAWMPIPMPLPISFAFSAPIEPESPACVHPPHSVAS